MIEIKYVTMGRTVLGRYKPPEFGKLCSLLNKGKISLDDLALFVPGVLHINNRKDLSFEYLSHKGCDLIGYSVEQLKRNGSKVLEKHQSPFTREVVHPRVLRELNNSSVNQGILFYQDWKFKSKPPFIFLTSTKILNSNSLLSISFFSDHTNYLTPKVNQIFRLNKVLKQYYIGYNNLTEREKEILSFLAREFTRQEIASQLYLSPGTVKKHCENIYRKLGTHKRIELEKISKINVFHSL